MKGNYKLNNLKRRSSKTKVDKEAMRIMISIKIDANDLAELKTEAVRQGLPYQTLINSILHRYVGGELLDRRELVNLGVAK